MDGGCWRLVEEEAVDATDYFITYTINLPKQIADYKRRRTQQRGESG